MCVSEEAAVQSAACARSRILKQKRDIVRLYLCVFSFSSICMRILVCLCLCSRKKESGESVCVCLGVEGGILATHLCEDISLLFLQAHTLTNTHAELCARQAVH